MTARPTARIVGEVAALVLVPAAMFVAVALDLDASAAFTFGVAILSLALLFAGVERSRPAMRQLMPTAVLAGVAAAGRVALAAVPDVKPVSAIAIVAGATLGRHAGFATGALAALISNCFFGQGAWTPWQMYAWGLVGYVGGLLGQVGLAQRRWVLVGWGLVSGPVYGLILNSWYVVGFVRPLTVEAVLSAFALGIPLDVVHGLATAAFLTLIWEPWRDAIMRATSRYRS